jgi:hypothetical protein
MQQQQQQQQQRTAASESRAWNGSDTACGHDCPICAAQAECELCCCARCHGGVAEWRHWHADFAKEEVVDCLLECPSLCFSLCCECFPCPAWRVLPLSCTDRCTRHLTGSWIGQFCCSIICISVPALLVATLATLAVCWGETSTCLETNVFTFCTLAGLGPVLWCLPVLISYWLRARLYVCNKVVAPQLRVNLLLAGSACAGLWSASHEGVILCITALGIFVFVRLLSPPWLGPLPRHIISKEKLCIERIDDAALAVQSETTNEWNIAGLCYGMRDFIFHTAALIWSVSRMCRMIVLSERSYNEHGWRLYLLHASWWLLATSFVSVSGYSAISILQGPFDTQPECEAYTYPTISDGFPGSWLPTTDPLDWCRQTVAVVAYAFVDWGGNVFPCAQDAGGQLCPSLFSAEGDGYYCKSSLPAAAGGYVVLTEEGSTCEAAGLRPIGANVGHTTAELAAECAAAINSINVAMGGTSRTWAELTHFEQDSVVDEWRLETQSVQPLRKYRYFADGAWNTTPNVLPPKDYLNRTVNCSDPINPSVDTLTEKGYR